MKTTAVASVREAIHGVAEKVTLKALADRGYRRVKVLDMATIERIVAEAVSREFERSGATAVPASRRAAITEKVTLEVPGLIAEEMAYRRSLESKIELLERKLLEAPSPPPPSDGAEDSRRALESKMELLERRLSKLGQAFADRDAAPTHPQWADEGIASCYKGIQGLPETAPSRDRKLALLSIVFNDNLALQRR